MEMHVQPYSIPHYPCGRRPSNCLGRLWPTGSIWARCRRKLCCPCRDLNPGPTRQYPSHYTDWAIPTFFKRGPLYEILGLLWKSKSYASVGRVAGTRNEKHPTKRNKIEIRLNTTKFHLLYRTTCFDLFQVVLIRGRWQHSYWKSGWGCGLD